MRKKKEMLYENIDIKNINEILNTLIKENKIKFRFYNSSVPLELLQLCHNTTNDTLELSFRDVMQEHINELKEINENIKVNKDN